MKTAQEWLDERDPLKNKNCTLADEWIAAIQADAFNAGERKGRIEGLREARSLFALERAYFVIGEHIEKLEREQQSKL